ncbi:hypothetical protein JCM3766R1_005390 [Sporobolomyces carnicolor]
MNHDANFRRLRATDPSDWFALVKRADELGNECFGSFGLRQNLQLLKRFNIGRKEQDGGLWQRAAEWASGCDKKEQEMVRASLQEMEKWLAHQLSTVNLLMVQEKNRQKQSQNPTTQSSDRMNPHQPQARPISRRRRSL